jgi:hypothetical protein
MRTGGGWGQEDSFDGKLHDVMQREVSFGMTGTGRIIRVIEKMRLKTDRQITVAEYHRELGIRYRL